MRLWSWITCCLAGNEDPITGGRWNTENPWHKVAVPLLKLSPEVGKDGIPVEGNTLAGMMYQMFEK